MEGASRKLVLFPFAIFFSRMGGGVAFVFPLMLLSVVRFLCERCTLADVGKTDRTDKEAEGGIKKGKEAREPEGCWLDVCDVFVFLGSVCDVFFLFRVVSFLSLPIFCCSIVIRFLFLDGSAAFIFVFYAINGFRDKKKTPRLRIVFCFLLL
jgi:hypothetical protein